ncbi:hypothetical protein [Lentzea sp.]|uniref:hypothetical protein n=1 Tax=Lentzea sp. TaxID=56099 RepID=UPI002CE57530|nr:hypothetical protein [Lentzea sp.]HUQ56631.1 hypothetical protein [Lentzea sp.]
MRRVLPLLLLLTACGEPSAGPKITDASHTGDTTAVTSAPTSTGRSPLGTAPDDLHAVDWQQATLTAAFCGVEGPVRFLEGKANATSTTWGEVGLWLSTDNFVRYGDIDADGRDEAAVNVGCDNGGGTASSQLAFGFVVVRADRGQLELVGEISATTMRDDAPHVPALAEPRFEKGAVTVKELWYRPSDANCCPTGASLTTWWLRDGTLKADQAVQVS